MEPTLGAKGAANGLRAVQRCLADYAPRARTMVDPGPTLEHYATTGEAPRLISALVIEGTTIRPRRILGECAAGFAAFLDGTQQSQVAGYLESGVPIVSGTVAAVIRERRQRRLVTWRHLVARRVYLPRPDVPPPLWDACVSLGLDPVDTAEPGSGAPRHPLALAERAVHLVQADRERVEQQLAEAWCAHAPGMLFVDGGVSGSDRVATSSCAVGVIKSHRTLYVEGDALGIVLGLQQGERSSVFRVTSPRRTSVASWYLRVRDPAGRDPMWGLVRIEIADDADPRRLAERADEVSRWVLAEAAPLSLPDSRWDKMVYGVRDCEEFLRAIC